MSIEYSELCPVTQQQVAQLMEHEDHIESAGDNAVTDIKTTDGKPLDVSEITPESLIEVNGITGQVKHMIEAGLVNESVLNGSYSDIEPTDEEEQDELEDSPYADSDALNTANQIEEAIGVADTFESVSAVLAGDELNPEVLEELSETYGVSPERAEREIHLLTEQLYEDFSVYAEDRLGVSDVDHFSEWVAYAANQNTKVRQLYQQAVTGALSGDFELAQDLVQEYRKYYLSKSVP